LQVLARILDVDARFVSLQKNPRDSDREVLRGLDILDLTDRLSDFEETAALMACLDLVITVDTSVAHLAGGLGCPVWVLLPYRPDYRWLLDRDDSPWYPTMRLFRQQQSRDYASVMPRDAGDDDFRKRVVQEVKLCGRVAAATAPVFIDRGCQPVMYPRPVPDPRRAAVRSFP
jgi:hypothetical protein